MSAAKNKELPGEVIVPNITREEQIERVTGLMTALMVDVAGYDEEGWPELKVRLDCDRAPALRPTKTIAWTGIEAHKGIGRA